MGKIIGIDLGTTNCCVSVFEGKTCKIIPNFEGQNLSSSAIDFDEEGVVIGNRINDSLLENRVSDFKKLIGTTKDTYFFGKAYSPEQLTALYFKYIKDFSEQYLNEKVVGAVVTVPSYFTMKQRKSIMNAGKMAGLEIKRIISESVAAAMTYAHYNSNIEKRLLVYKMGSGYVDVSISDIESDTVEVLSVTSDLNLGGNDFVQVIVNWIVQRFYEEHGEYLTNDKMAFSRVKEAAEKAMKDLSSRNQVQINCPFIMVVDGMPQHLDYTLTREKFNQLTQSLITRAMYPVQKALLNAGLTKKDIHQVVVAGGATRIPAIRDALYNTIKVSIQHPFNEDEIVAMGAAIQGGILSGSQTNLILFDVLPLSLGIETMGGIMTKIIPQNTSIPEKESMIFSTAQDNQTFVDICVYQGEEAKAKDNEKIVECRLQGIPLAPKGVPQIEVTFNVQADGILNVSAKELGSKRVVEVSGEQNSIESIDGIHISYQKRETKEKKTMSFEKHSSNASFKTQGSIPDVVYLVCPRCGNLNLHGSPYCFRCSTSIDKCISINDGIDW